MAGNGLTRTRRRSSVLSLPDRIFDGYLYRFAKKLTNNARRLYCCKRSSNACNAAGSLSASDDFTYLPGKNRHNHEPDINSDCKSRFKKDLYIACRHQFRDLQIIYRDVSIIHEEASALLNFNQMKPQMQSWQRNQKFPVITSSAEFKSCLAEENFKDINRHNSGRTELQFLQNISLTHSAIIFSDVNLLSKVETSQLFIKSTITNLPEGVGALQLTSISTQYADHVFPVVWIIELEKSENSCTKIAEALLSLKPIISPREIYGDFDDNYYKAMKTIFPEASMKGTFYSHCQIMVDAAVRFGIDLEDNSTMLIFTKIVSLSLLPGNKIKTSFYWIISSMSVNQRNHFKHVLSGHNQCHFHLQNLQLKGRMNWNSNKVKNLFNGVKNCKFIVNCWKSMEEEDSDFEDFLRKTSHILSPVLRNIMFVGVVLPAQFDLVKLTVTQNVGQLRAIPTLPNDRLLAEATRMDLRAIDRQTNEANDDDEFLPDLADHLMDAESTTEEANEDVNEANDDVELSPGPANHPMAAESVTEEANEDVNEANNDVELPPGPADVIAVDENIEATEVVIVDARVSEQCLICRVGKTPTKLYRPCLHVVTCGPCNNKWFKTKMDEGQLFTCVLCRDLVQETEDF